MVKGTFRLIDLMYLVAILLFDFAIYMVFGMLLMGYEDTYDCSKGEYWSFASMNNLEKVFFIALNIWHVLNIAGVTYLVYQIFRRVKYRKSMVEEK